MADKFQLGKQQGKVERCIYPLVEAMGFQLVRVTLTGETHKLKLQVMAEPSDDSEMTVDHCAELSRAISAKLDVEDPISGAYTLEVSSPGIERPLVRRADFCRYSGYDVQIDAIKPHDGRRRFVGRLIGLDKDQVVLSLADADYSTENIEIPFKNISRANLVLTNELINDTVKKRRN